MSEEPDFPAVSPESGEGSGQREEPSLGNPFSLPEVRSWWKQWDPLARPEGPADWFESADEMPAFDPESCDFDPANAWWLAELCRIAYTPDAKEAPRPLFRDRPTRHRSLQDRTPFREILNLHKTANHVALYSLEGRPGRVLCFRGTTRFRQWLMNLNALPISWDRANDPACDTEDRVYVHQGFRLLFDRLWPLVEPHLQETEDEPLVITGHSLGGAFATLAAAVSPVRPRSLTTFGSPRVGNLAFASRLDGIPIHRVVNHQDVVGLVPTLDAKLGHRDFRHAGNLVLLGDLPGSVQLLPGPEDPRDPAWAMPSPADLLRASMGKSEIPAWAKDHAPRHYAEKLRALARESPVSDPSD